MRLTQDRMVTVTATLGAAAVAGATAVARKRMAARSAATSAATDAASTWSASGGDQPGRASDRLAARSGTETPGGPRTAAQIVAEAAQELDAIDASLAPSPADPETRAEDKKTAIGVDFAAGTAARSTDPAPSDTGDEATGVALSSYARLAKKYGTETDTGKQTTLLLAEVDDVLDPAVIFEADPESQAADDTPSTVQDERSARENPEFARVVSNSLTGAFIILGLICQFLAVGLAAERDPMFLAPQVLVVVLVFVVYAMRARFNAPTTGSPVEAAPVGGDAITA